MTALKRPWPICISAALLLLLLAGAAAAGDLPQAGDHFPALEFPAPADARAATVLGVPPGKPFAVQDVRAELVLVEVIGVYCAFCVEQLPSFNRLHARLVKAGLSGRIKMLALAAGGTPQETQLLGKEYAYPVLPDESYALHRILGEPKTPFTLLVDRQGVIRFVHLGVLRDLDGLYALMKQLAGSP